MGHTTLHAGEVTLDGHHLNGVPCFRRALAGIGFVPQEREIFPSLSVRENLNVAARPGPWTLARVFELFRALPSGSTIWAISFPAASSRCCRLRVRC